MNIQRITGVAHCANVVWLDLDEGDGNGRQATGLGEDDTKAPQDQDGPLWLAEMGSMR